MARVRQKRSDAKTERNRAIYKLWKDGYSTYELARVFDLTAQRVYQILENELENSETLDKGLQID